MSQRKARAGDRSLGRSARACTLCVLDAPSFGRDLDWRLRRDLLDHQVESVPLIGWAGIENGELLRKAVEAGFDLLVTMDSNMVHEQNIGQYAIAVVALRAQSNRLANTRPLMPALLAVLPQVKPGTVTFLPEAA